MAPWAPLTPTAAGCPAGLGVGGPAVVISAYQQAQGEAHGPGVSLLSALEPPWGVAEGLGLPHGGEHDQAAGRMFLGLLLSQERWDMLGPSLEEGTSSGEGARRGPMDWGWTRQ